MLERSAGTGSSAPGPAVSWFVRNAFGLGALGIGFASLLGAFYMQFAGKRDIDQIPDLRVTLPLLAVALGAAVGAFVRHESARNMSVIGVGMAGAALALGWVLVACGVAAASLIVIAIIAKFN